MSCSRCSRDPMLFQRESGTHLCREHFLESVRKRVRAEFHRQVDLKGDERMAVAYSGGKDSALALNMVAEIVRPMRGIDLRAIIVDEGIEGYRDMGLPMARSCCRSLGIELVERSMSEELGVTVDSIAALERRSSACTYCGVLRRRLMNEAARELGADHLVTGLNLDDTVQGILMNIFRGDVERLARMGPHDNLQLGLVPRVQPLRRIPEKESMLFALLEGLKFHDAECPYAPEAMRNAYRDMVSRMDERFPGTKFSILSTYDAIREALQRNHPPTRLLSCSCGEPSVDGKCKSCQLLEELRGTAH